MLQAGLPLHFLNEINHCETPLNDAAAEGYHPVFDAGVEHLLHAVFKSYKQRYDSRRKFILMILLWDTTTISITILQIHHYQYTFSSKVESRTSPLLFQPTNPNSAESNEQSSASINSSSSQSSEQELLLSSLKNSFMGKMVGCSR